MSTELSVPSMKIARISAWVDRNNRDRDPEALSWHRIAKVAEESGEALAAWLGVTGQNPRKGVTHDEYQVVEELLDVAIAALGAVEHLTKNRADSMRLLVAKIDKVHARAGLEP